MISDFLKLDLDKLRVPDLDMDLDIRLDLDTDLDMDLDIFRSTWTQFRTKNGYCARMLYAVIA